MDSSTSSSSSSSSTFSKVIEVPLKFVDSDELIIVRDKKLLKLLPTVERAVACYVDDWENEDVILSEPLACPFKREVGLFVLQNVEKYNESNDGKLEVAKEKYKEAFEKDLMELRDIIELGCFWDISKFISAIGVVIASKLESKSVGEVLNYLGLEDDYPGTDDETEWMHPPVEAVQPDNN